MDMANLARRWCVCENWVSVSQQFPANPSEHFPNFGERSGGEMGMESNMKQLELMGNRNHMILLVHIGPV